MEKHTFVTRIPYNVKHEQRLILSDIFKQCFISILFLVVKKHHYHAVPSQQKKSTKYHRFSVDSFCEVQTWRCGKGLQIWRESLRGTSVRCLQDQSLERTGPARERSAGQMGGKGMNETMGLLGTATMMWGDPFLY